MNAYQRREMTNYASWALGPGHAVAACGAFATALGQKIGQRLRRSAGKPPYLDAREIAVTGETARPPWLEAAPGGGSHVRELEVPTLALATGDFPIEALCSWELEAEDPEDLYALHRFGWALRMMVERPGSTTTETVKRAILGWIRGAPRDTAHAAWGSYNVSERIVNWLFFIACDGGWAAFDGAERAAVRESISRQADHLLRHLEYHGPGRTNNHLLNNGRALYIAGTLLELQQHLRAGRRIVLEETQARFSPSGFLTEGSSHYHLLLTRTLLEVLSVAGACGDAALGEALLKPTVRAVRCCQFFFPAPEGPLPLIGDVSPDFPPEWLLGVKDVAGRPSSVPARGWNALFAASPWPIPDSLREELEAEADPALGVVAHPDPGWYRCVTPRHTVFWHADLPRSAADSSHAHHDLGSFELHAGTQPLAVDAGRSTYRTTPEGVGARSARSHNTVVVDGWEPAVTLGLNRHRVMANDYGRQRVDVEWREGNGAQELEIRHDGFARVAGLGPWSRRCTMSPRGIRLTDRLEGAGRRRIESFFHFHPSVDVTHDAGARTILLRWPAGSAKLLYACEGLQSVDLAAGRFSPRYGVAVPAWSVRFVHAARLPAGTAFEFELS